MNREEEKVRRFYDTYGWVQTAGVSGEHALFRAFSPPCYPYHNAVNARTMAAVMCLSGLPSG